MGDPLHKPLYDYQRDARSARAIDQAFGRVPYTVKGFTILYQRRRDPRPVLMHFTFRPRS